MGINVGIDLTDRSQGRLSCRGGDQEEEEDGEDGDGGGGEDEGQDRDYIRGDGDCSQEEGDLTDTDRADEEGCKVRCPQRRRLSSSSAGKSLLVYEYPSLSTPLRNYIILIIDWISSIKPQERHQVASLDHQGAGGRREKTQEQGLRQAGAAPQQYDAAALAGLEQSQSRSWGGGRAESLWPAWSDYESAGQ
ncbi:hypothetical protein OIY81_3301 [Cryptosporidium canis]|uniref:Uncharacterized protein n=1 Tax=Cryptosporidium canis TaxID=195482 RepID=A0ABQ8P295_9CRYT|nr:hypothetical protein OJ252_3472 [Cryptosporidium canis]KAJ1606109.1 hypothetical protein OIY81_3301 [Cryptosporidium canis]